MICRTITFRAFSLILLGLFVFTTPLLGSVFKTADGIIVARNDSIQDDLYTFGNFVEINGMVDGDVLAFVYDFSSSGTVLGNINVFTYSADIRGTIDKSVRAFANSVAVGGEINRDVLLVGNQLSIRKATLIGRDLVCMGSEIRFSGVVKNDATLQGNTVIISGTIEGNVKVKAGQLSIYSPAVIKGNLVYESVNEMEIDDDVIIEGETTWDIPEEEEDKAASPWSYLFDFVLFLLTLTTGFMLILIVKSHTRESVRQIHTRPGMTFAVGFITLAVCTVGALVAIILVIGIPIGVVMICGGVILFYVGKVYVAIALGRGIFRIFRPELFPIGVEFIVGLIILTLLFHIPYLGAVIYFLTVILGMGAAVNAYLAISKICREALKEESSESIPG